MSQLINFDDYKIKDAVGKESIAASSHSNSISSKSSGSKVDTYFRITLEVLIKNNPGRTILSLHETAEQLNVSEEFIRRRIKSGKIKATYLGDKPLINIVELARIITEGV